MYKNLAAMRLWACLLSACFSLSAIGQNTIPAVTVAAVTPPLKIGFVYVAPLTDAGWVRQHDEGRKAVEAALNAPGAAAKVKTSYVENVAEGPDAERVIRDLAASGHTLIFTPSFGYMEPTLNVAKDFPGVRFESITGYKNHRQCGSGKCPLLRGPLPGRHCGGAHDTNRTGGLCCRFPHP